MKLNTIKSLAIEIEKHWVASTNHWRKIDCIEEARKLKDFLWYIENCLNSFPETVVKLNKDNLLNDTVIIQYNRGGAKIPIDFLSGDILLPKIIDICRNYGKSLIGYEIKTPVYIMNKKASKSISRMLKVA